VVEILTIGAIQVRFLSFPFLYNVQFVKHVSIEDVHHVVGSAVQCGRNLILGIRRDAVAAESADLMFVDRADPAATRVDVIFLVVVDGIRWGKK